MSPAAHVELERPDHPYVGRGGVKLAHALDASASGRGRRALDIGASTGGFTDVLLQRGARDVIALDVGHGQLDWRLRTDPRVHRPRRRQRARADARRSCRTRSTSSRSTSSFISLRHILPAVPPVLAPGADIVALVKPQFEAGRDEVGKGGIVTDPAVHEAVLAASQPTPKAGGFERCADGRRPSPAPPATASSSCTCGREAR